MVLSDSAVIDYPDSDGEPMSDNTEQFEFIQTVQGNLDAILPDFVAGDHLWYPVQGHPEIRIGPDVYVALGRPKGHRGSYLQWVEDDQPIQVVFEWWSPRNDFAQQAKKLLFYNRYGVQEFYTFDQTRRIFNAFVREEDDLQPQSTEGGFVSPLLGVRFEVKEGQLVLFAPDGSRFLSMREMKAAGEQAEAARAHAEEERARAEEERARAEEERARAEARAVALAQKLRALGIDPDAP